MTTLLQAIELETGPNPTHAVIWLHGLGADGNDFVPIVEDLDLPRLSIRFVFPHAPMRPVTINGGHIMRAWYDILGIGAGREEDASGIRASQTAIEALIERETQRGIARDNIVLAGFSQGGAITLQTGLRQSHALAGLMVLSSYLPLADTVAAERSAASRRIPILMAHGTQDGVLPLSMGTTSRGALLALGYNVDWHEYTMAHSVCAQEVADISLWLSRVLHPPG
jgi:phospholipase/carboxylesterase